MTDYSTRPKPYSPATSNLISRFDGEYAFLSNFWPWDGTQYVEPPFEVKGRLVKTAEHAFQAQKTVVPSLRDGILGAETPGRAKQRGRQAPLRDGWEQIKVEVMRQILQAKFASAAPGVVIAPLSVKLLATGDKHLIEGNYWNDTFWGCVHPQEGSNLWVGANMLGILLMERRAQLQREIPY